MEASQGDKTQIQSKSEPQTESKQASTEQVTQPISNRSSGSKMKKIVPLVAILFIIAAGSVSGLYLASTNKKPNQKAAINQESLTPEAKQSFTQTFRDQAEGTIEKNDKLDKYAQGTHKLIRPGGEDQTAYLTSSVLDLDQYAGKKVRVYGETFGSSQVGWLMDVGKVEIIQ